MHRVAVDRVHALVSLTVTGFLGPQDLRDAAGDLHAAIRSLGPRMGQHVTLYDLTGLNVVTREVLDAFTRYFTDAAVAPLWARRVALVCGSSLVTLQMGRVSQVRDTLRVFDARPAAVAWLLEIQERSRTISQPTVASA